MKKRFTIMLDQNVIDKIKRLNKYWTPTAVRENIESELEAWAEYNLGYLDGKDALARYQFDDK